MMSWKLPLFDYIWVIISFSIYLFALSTISASAFILFCAATFERCFIIYITFMRLHAEFITASGPMPTSRIATFSVFSIYHFIYWLIFFSALIYRAFMFNSFAYLLNSLFDNSMIMMQYGPIISWRHDFHISIFIAKSEHHYCREIRFTFHASLYRRLNVHYMKYNIYLAWCRVEFPYLLY